MLVDLLAQSNYMNFNIKLAKTIGLHQAIYLSALIDINEKAERKNKVSDNFFSVDRKYITSRTTLKEEEQKEIEKILCELGIINKTKTNNNLISIDMAVLTSIVMSNDEELLKDISKIINRKANKKSKGELAIDNAMSVIKTDNDTLRKAYEDWIKSVYDKDGRIVPTTVEVAQDVLDNYTLMPNGKHNLEVALKIIQIATIGGYRDINWAINNYSKDYKKSFKISRQSTNESGIINMQLSNKEY